MFTASSAAADDQNDVAYRDAAAHRAATAVGCASLAIGAVEFAAPAWHRRRLGAPAAT